MTTTPTPERDRRNYDKECVECGWLGMAKDVRATEGACPECGLSVKTIWVGRIPKAVLKGDGWYSKGG